MPIVGMKQEFFNNDAQTNFNSSTHANPGMEIKQISKSSTNILLEGIRGTGKTHILKMIREENLNNFKENRILPVYISLAKLSEYETMEDEKFRIHLYTSIVHETIDVIKDNVDLIERADDPFNLKMLSTDAPILELFQDRPLSEVLEEIENLLAKLNKELLVGDLKIQEGDTKSHQGAITVKGVKVSTGVENQRNIEYVINALSHNNASRYIIEFFRGLYSILELNYSLILLDEISGVSSKAQVEVFRLLRLIRASTEVKEGGNYLYFIGGVYPPQKTNYPSKENDEDFDFIPGEDCSMEYLEMDVLHEEYESFFKFITERRLQEIHPESDGNIQWLFEDERTFLLAAFAANGLPRRYFEILKNAYSTSSKTYSSYPEIKRLDYTAISSAIQAIVDSQTLNENQLTERDFHLLDKVIIPRFQQRNSSAETKNESRGQDDRLPVHLFLSVSRSDRRKLGNLIYRGVIHNLSRTRKSRTSTNNDHEQRGIMMMLDLAVAFNYRVFNVQKAVEYFIKDLRENARRGYLYFTEFTLPTE